MPYFASSSRKKLLERFMHSSDPNMALEREDVQGVLGYLSLLQAFHRAWECTSHKALLHVTVQRTMMETVWPILVVEISLWRSWTYIHDAMAINISHLTVI